MVKQVKVTAPIQSLFTSPENTDLPLVEIVEPPLLPTEEPQTVIPTSVTTINNTINNIGIQANNVFITSLSESIRNFNPAAATSIANTIEKQEKSKTTALKTLPKPKKLTKVKTQPLQLSSFDPAGYVAVPYGSQELINIGAFPNDGTGDPLRVAFDKINNNFSNLFLTTFNTSLFTTTGIAPNQVILEVPAVSFMQGTFQIRSYDPNTSDMQNVTLSASITNNATGVKFTGYATTFDGNALCRYNMDVFDDSVRILVNPLQNVDIDHYISYQVTDSTAVEGPAISLDGYPVGSIMGTEDDLEIITEGI